MPSHKGIICDLGLGKVKDMVTMVTREGTNAGTLAYQHKEQLEGKPPKPAVDVYSFGIITLEVYTRVNAWKGHSAHEIREKIMNGEFPKIAEGIPEEVKDLIRKCFQTASQRPTFTELMPVLLRMAEKDIKFW